MVGELRAGRRRRAAGLGALTAVAVAVAVCAAPADAQVREARFWVTVSGSQFIEWNEAPHETGRSCFAVRTSSGGGDDSIRFSTQRRFKLLALSYNPRTVTLEEGSWNRERLEAPPITARVRLAREGVHRWTQEPGECGGRFDTGDTGPYDCGSQNGRWEVALSLERRKRLRVLPHGNTEGAPDGFADCPLVEPSELVPDGFDELSAKLTPKQLFGTKRKFVLKASETFEQRPDEHTRTTGTVSWTVTLTRAR